jgi:hypothetical protein
MESVKMNTQIEYMYRDNSNYKQHDHVIFTGEITDEQRATILGALDGDRFIAEQVGLENLGERFGGSYEDDGPWHELEEITLTEEEANSGSQGDEENIDDFVQRFVDIKWEPWRYGDNNPVGTDTFATITVVIRGSVPPAGYDLTEAVALMTDDETMFVSIESGVTPNAIALGAEYGSWGDANG